MIDLELATPVVECAETVRGTVRWGGEGSSPPTAVEVALGYRTEGRGRPDSDQPVSVRFDSGGATEGEVEFELAAPFDGPITYEGPLLQVVWQVTARLDRPLTADESASALLTVFPRGGHAVWARLAPPPR